jgi:hypothetical protein
MKKKLIALIATSFFCSQLFTQNIAVTQSGPPGVWQNLGTANISFTIDHESIVITGTSEFRAIKFKVADASVTILHMNFVYAKGHPDKFNVNYYIPAEGESRIIDMKGGAKKLARVDFWYQSDKQDSGKIAKVSLWGMK